MSKPIERFHSRGKQACKFIHAEQKEVLQEGKTTDHAYAHYASAKAQVQRSYVTICVS